MRELNLRADLDFLAEFSYSKVLEKGKVNKRMTENLNYFATKDFLLSNHGLQNSFVDR